MDKLNKQIRERDEKIAKLQEDLQKNKSTMPYVLTVSLGVLIALIVNAFLLYSQKGYVNQEENTKNIWPVLDFRRNDLYSEKEKVSESNRLFQLATTFSGEKGEGRQGWLHLLASYTYDPKNLHIVSNLFDNYEALNYGSIGYSTLLESGISQTDIDSICPKDRQQDYAKQLNLATKDIKDLKSDPGEGDTTLMFTTAVSRWNVSEYLPIDMNEAIYTQSVNAYEKLKKERPKLSPTDLNHAFFRVQMAELDTSSSYWGPFKDIPGFADLVATMRKCVLKFLKDHHGWSEADALRKSSHPMIVWVSVHTAESVHQPHVTEDALIGGVYYVSVPQGSGKLHMYDPRGKHPLRDLDVPTSPPNPPFHRIVSLDPTESLLVLFPGWLVHSVGRANVPSFQGGKYRVSLSLNLKGEWSDTAGAAFGVPTY